MHIHDINTIFKLHWHVIKVQYPCEFAPYSNSVTNGLFVNNDFNVLPLSQCIHWSFGGSTVIYEYQLVASHRTANLNSQLWNAEIMIWYSLSLSAIGVSPFSPTHVFPVNWYCLKIHSSYPKEKFSPNAQVSAKLHVMNFLIINWIWNSIHMECWHFVSIILYVLITRTINNQTLFLEKLNLGHWQLFPMMHASFPLKILAHLLFPVQVMCLWLMWVHIILLVCFILKIALFKPPRCCQKADVLEVIMFLNNFPLFCRNKQGNFHCHCPKMSKMLQKQWQSALSNS